MLKIEQEDLKRGSVHAEMEDADISSEKEDICRVFVIYLMTLKVPVLGKWAAIHSTGCMEAISKKDTKQEMLSLTLCSN